MPTISGTIIDGAGRPLAGATLRITAIDTGDLAALTDVVTGAPVTNPLTTDALGAYEAEIAGGSYLLIARKGTVEVKSTVQLDAGLGSEYGLFSVKRMFRFMRLTPIVLAQGTNMTLKAEATP